MHRPVLKITTLTLLTYCLLLLAPAVWAGAESGFYIGGAVGGAEQDLDTDSIDLDDDATAAKVFAGYNIGLIPLLDFAVEASYVDFGEISASSNGTNASAELTAVDGFGLIGIKLGAIGLFAKTGLVRWDSEATVGSLTSEDSGTDSVSGIGVRFQLWSIAIRAEYEEFDIENADVSMYSVGASWTF